jgi:uncharacterized membrane protein YdjX (TVP38/TMEM64 family)
MTTPANSHLQFQSKPRVNIRRPFGTNHSETNVGAIDRSGEYAIPMQFVETSADPVPPQRSRLKFLTVAIWLCLLAGALWFFLGTTTGAEIWSHTDSLSKQIRAFAALHWLAAPIAYTCIYVLLGILAMPIWWLQFLGGIGFGFYYGCGLSLVASTVSATLTVLVVRWIAADWFHRRVASRMERLKKLDEMMGHNGFLVVMTVRLMHVLPFGVCNYALGLSKVSYRDVLIGTLIGNIPATAIYVGIGAGYDVSRN